MVEEVDSQGRGEVKSLALALLLAFAGPAQARAQDTKPAVVELRQSDTALRATYRKGQERQLPRLLLFDGAQRPLLVETGMRGGVGRRLAKALDKDQSLPAPLTLDAVLAETVDADGNQVAIADLPKADGYVVDYWAEWCAPCRELGRDIERQLARWDRRVAWIKIESDPEKLPENRK